MSQKNIYMFFNIIKHSSMLKRTKVKIGSRTRSQEEDQGWVIQGLPGHCRKFRAKQRSNKWGTKNVLIHIVTRVCMLSHLVTNNSATPRTADCQIPLPMGLLRQEFWSGLSFPSPGALKPVFPTSSFIGRQILYHCTSWKAPCIHSVDIQQAP